MSQVTGKPEPARRADHVDALGAREPGEVHARAGVPREYQDGREGDRLGAHGNRGQAEAGRDLAVVRDAVCARAPRPAGAATPESRTSRRTAARGTAPGCRRAARRPARTRRSPRRRAPPSRSAARPSAPRSARRPGRRAPVQVLGAELEHLAPVPARRAADRCRAGRRGSSRRPAMAASISDSRVARYSKPGSRSRAARSTSPGQTMRPVASIMRLAV